MFIRSFLIAIPILLTGCVTQTHTFEGQEADSVWTAMLAVAKTPNYKTGPPVERWSVRENRVWVNEEQNRIEIFRRLERVLYQPASRPRYEDRQWKFQVVLEERDPPTVSFTSREFGVPSRAWDEADRFLNEVWDVLGGDHVEPELPPEPNPSLPTSGNRYDN